MNALDRRRRQMALTRIILLLILAIAVVGLGLDTLDTRMQAAIALLLGLPLIAVVWLKWIS